MSKKEVIVCDGCGKIIESVENRFKFYLKTDEFWNGVEMDYFMKEFDFCHACAMDIKKALEKIAERLEKEEQS